MKKLKKLLLTLLLLSVVTAAALVSASAASTAYGAGTVSASSLNLREGAGTSSRVASQLRRGETVVILDKTDTGWYRVASGGKTGYVAAKYITDIGTVKSFTMRGAVSGSDALMRRGPSDDSEVLGQYDDGAAVTVTGIDNGWFEAAAEGTTGYIRSDLISLTDEAGPVSDLAAAAASARADTVTAAAAETAGQQIAAFASQFAGYRYIYGASSPSVGFDCSGLTYYVYGQFGYRLSRTASQQFKNNGTAVSKADLLPGDLVFFSSNGGRSVTHVGLYVGDGAFVNASTSRTGVIISSLSSSWYTRTWYGAKRIV